MLLVLALVFTLPSRLCAQTNRAGSITALHGKVSIERRGSAPLVGRVNDPVEIGDRVVTGPNSRATITLSDGTQLGLDESASMVIVDSRLDASGHRLHTEIDLLNGLVHSLVRHAPGNAPNFEVHTPNAVAAARGTDYDTDYVEGEKRQGYDGCLKFTDVRVYDGVVEVWNSATPNAIVKVSKGHKTVVPCANPPTPPGTPPLLAEGAIATTLAGGGVVTGLGVGGYFGGGGGGGGYADPPARPPLTAAQ